MFPKLKQNLESSLKPDQLKEFLRNFSNPFSMGDLLVDEKLYCGLDSTSQILGSLHPTYINAGNVELLRVIVDSFGSDPSKTLLKDYGRQWE
jgi:hypothetical protein